MRMPCRTSLSKRLAPHQCWPVIILALLAQPVSAQAPRGGPPPEAFAACTGVATGAACRINTPRGKLEGTCRVMREDRPVCVPGQGWEGPPDRRQGGSGVRPGSAGAPHGATIQASNAAALAVGSRIPDTNQGNCFDARQKINCPTPGQAYYGQDAQYLGAKPDYRDNGDGTVTDGVTGLIWQKAHTDARLDWYAARDACRALDLGGKRDWRLPSIKELFSLADFRGSQGRHAFIDEAFEFREPGAEVLEGDRFASTHTTGMMGQTWSDTRYTGVHYGRPGVEAAFFFNFLDGHIKQAPTRGRSKLFYRCVRGAPWGDNRFVDHDDGTVEDTATALVWQQADDGRKRDWPQALSYCQSLTLGGKSDWRLPNIKELESIVDYSRHAPALDQRHLRMSDPAGWFWSSTTHGDNISHAAYVCFGPCTSTDGVDVHGAGAQRSDPKTGDPKSFGSLGGQRDEVRIRNYARCVR